VRIFTLFSIAGTSRISRIFIDIIPLSNCDRKTKSTLPVGVERVYETDITLPGGRDKPGRLSDILILSPRKCFAL
jgi:hypothetical protein